ncbi:hypothetical protein [Halococcus thailandensis]|uniref:Sulfatase n=1 Tax=Halococcus thailandensis JCM 13552 TaxID=1227457 RepID=M0NCC4_9EURY|nr:hypothetical protein [Halococcus thailandensis]EMA54330.1 hypothetical protein C451_06765 [Halococcus thailandensis JCM 13552]
MYHNRDEIDTTLYYTINIWREEGWNEEHGTMLPETVTKYAQRAASEQPNKLIIHYIQPHYPFIESETEFDKRHLTAPDTDEQAGKEENVWGS